VCWCVLLASVGVESKGFNQGDFDAIIHEVDCPTDLTPNHAKNTSDMDGRVEEGAMRTSSSETDSSGKGQLNSQPPRDVNSRRSSGTSQHSTLISDLADFGIIDEYHDQVSVQLQEKRSATGFEHAGGDQGCLVHCTLKTAYDIVQ
jgi:hypothetical protein